MSEIDDERIRQEFEAATMRPTLTDEDLDWFEHSATYRPVGLPADEHRVSLRPDQVLQLIAEARHWRQLNAILDAPPTINWEVLPDVQRALDQARGR